MKRLKIILQSRYLFKVLAVLFLLFAFLFTKYYKFTSKYSIDETTFKGIVYNYELKEDKLTIYIKGKEKLIINYKYSNLEFNSLSYGDTILVKGVLKKTEESTIPNTFDYKKYLYNKKIYYQVEASSIDKIKNNSNYIYTIKNLFNKRVEKLKSKNYIKTFLLGDNNISDEIKESYRTNGISHLFSISGMHINLIIGIIYFYLNKITYHKKIKYIITNIFLIIYLILAFSSSLLRSVIMNILFSINFIFKLKIKKIDIMLITLLVAIIINPFIIYDIGFIYSYLISFFLICFSKKTTSKVKRIINTTIISFLVSFPITIYNCYEINIISIVLNILIVPIVSTIVFPLTIITFIFPILDNVLYYITNLLEKISLFISNIEFTKLIFSKPSILLLIIYYIIIIIILKKHKYLYILIITIIFHYLLPYFNNNLNIITFDVGQGDSILINYPNNTKNILIDTGYSSYKIKNNIIPYLKSKGIRKINYLIITHGDQDHIGGALTLVENFKVEKVIFNCGPYNDLESELIKVLDKKHIKYYSCIKELNIDKNKLYFLQTEEFGNENDNSNVIYTELNNYKFLFMGDASSTTEKEILSKYNLPEIDVLKVGHHGSKTSSSIEFIDEINPKYSIISVGKNNRYGHPNKEVLENLNNSKIYRTDQDGSIMFKIKNNKLKIETCSP
ncbi:MAG: DNA internalization-related competence protein ComEC/Rec2 [Bacilli bacterium]|nr:DNA internalization-related competence protein ComEC/Rec2 [Bacilli bacterium]